MKLRVGYVQCNEQPVEGSLDQTLIRVMDCGSVTNGGSVQTVYQNGGTEILYPKDPIAVDYPAPTDQTTTLDSPPPPPPPLPEDQPAETMQTITPTTTDPLPATESGSNNTLLIGGGLLLLFLLLGKKKKRK
jgi:LPXTG-motif cell wall-anchored protein